MDTANDFRILMAEAVSRELAKTLAANRLRGHFDKAGAEAAVGGMKTELMALKYSYAEPEALEALSQAKGIVAAASGLETSLGGPGWQNRIKDDKMAVAFVRFALANLRNFPQRFKIPGNNPENGVDVLVGEVLSAHKHPAADNLLITNVDAGHAFTVVTNDLTVKAGSAVAVAHLPPTDLRGVMSEAMYCGLGGKVMTGVAGKRGTRPVLPDNAYVQVRNVISAWLKR